MGDRPGRGPTTTILEDDGETFEVVGPSAIDARFLFDEIFRVGTYAGFSLPEGARVIDVGANIGLFSLYVKRRFPTARVAAFEPAPELADALRRNVEGLGLDDVDVHAVALGAEAGEVAFTYYPVLPSSSTLYPDDLGALKDRMRETFPTRVLDRMYRGVPIVVPLARLSSYLAGEAVDLLKIDAVGSEEGVLRGIDGEHWPAIRRVVVDVQDVAGRIERVVAVLRENGMDVDVRPAPAASGDGLNFVVSGTARPGS